MYPDARDGAHVFTVFGNHDATAVCTWRRWAGEGVFLVYMQYCSPFALFFSPFRSERDFTAGDFTVRFYRAGMATYGRYSSAFYPRSYVMGNELEGMPVLFRYWRVVTESFIMRIKGTPWRVRQTSLAYSLRNSESIFSEKRCWNVIGT